MSKVISSECTLKSLFHCYLSKHSDTPTMIVDSVSREITKSIHLPGLRGNPERTYKLTGTGYWYRGTFENYVASLIYEWQQNADKPLETLDNPFDRQGLGEEFQEYQNYSNPEAILVETLYILGLPGKVGAKKSVTLALNFK